MKRKIEKMEAIVGKADEVPRFICRMKDGFHWKGETFHNAEDLWEVIKDLPGADRTLILDYRRTSKR